MKKITIAIDGFSSCGKSTLAKALASRLSYRYIDTGAMYRAVALYCMRNGLMKEDVDRIGIINALPDISIDFKYNKETDDSVTFLNGEDVEEEIRGVEVSKEVSKVSQISEVRNKLVDQQQKMGEEKGVVMDGRDIGTRVFPKAELKLFITADPEERVNRRYNQMISKGVEVKKEDVRANLEQRDYNDVHLGDTPLKKAEDAIEIDNTHLSIEAQFDMAYDLALNAINDNFQSV